MNLQEMDARMEAIRSEIRGIEDNPGAHEETDADYVDQLVAEYEGLEARREPLAERAEKLNVIMSTNVAEAAEPEAPRSTSPVKRANPFEGIEELTRSEVIRPSEIRGRALDAVEYVRRSQWVDFDDDGAEAATRLIERSKDDPQLRGLPRHILATGSEEYLEGFRAYMRDPLGLDISRASMTVGTGGLGYMLPFVLDPTIILTNAGAANPYRQIARVVQTTSVTWNGVTSAGVNAAMSSEAGALADVSPTVAQLQITPQRAQAWVFGSYEALEDSDIGTQLPRLFADAKNRLEESQFATGAGTGIYPQGIVTGGTTGATAASTAYAVADVYTLQGRLGPRFRNSPSASWVSNLFYINKTRQFDTAGGSSFWANLGQGTPEMLLGKPIFESSSMTSSTAASANVLVFADFEQFVIVDRIGMSVRYNDMVMSSATANVPTGEAGFFAFWRFSSKVSTANAVQVMQIKP